MCSAAYPIAHQSYRKYSPKNPFKILHRSCDINIGKDDWQLDCAFQSKIEMLQLIIYPTSDETNIDTDRRELQGNTELQWPFRTLQNPYLLEARKHTMAGVSGFEGTSGNWGADFSDINSN